MDQGIILAFICSVLISAIFVCFGFYRFYRMVQKKENELYIIGQRNEHIIDLSIELVDREEKKIDNDLLLEEEFKKAA